MLSSWRLLRRVLLRGLVPRQFMCTVLNCALCACCPLLVTINEPQWGALHSTERPPVAMPVPFCIWLLSHSAVCVKPSPLWYSAVWRSTPWPLTSWWPTQATTARVAAAELLQDTTQQHICCTTSRVSAAVARAVLSGSYTAQVSVLPGGGFEKLVL